MFPKEGKALPGLKGDASLYFRSWMMGYSVDAHLTAWKANFFAMEGPATNSRFRNEETSCVRQAAYDRANVCGFNESQIVIVPPTSAKLALTGKGNADKMAMVNAALSQTRGTLFHDTLSALVKPGRKHNPEAEAIADAFGVARAAAKILFQRNAREVYAAPR